MSTHDNAPPPPDWSPERRPCPVTWLDDYRQQVEDESHIVRGTE